MALSSMRLIRKKIGRHSRRPSLPLDQIGTFYRSLIFPFALSALSFRGGISSLMGHFFDTAFRHADFNGGRDFRRDS